MNAPKTTGKIAGVALDMDGVIFDSERMYYESFISAVEHLNLPEAKDWARHLTGLSTAECLRFLRFRLPDTLPIERFVPYWLAERDRWLEKNGLPLMAGAEALIHALAGQCPLALVTSAERHMMEENFRLSKTDLLSCFDVVVTVEDVARPKPDPQAYERAAALLGIVTEEMLVVEDSLHGAQAAIDAGAQLLFMSGRHLPAGHTPFGALARIEHLSEVWDFI